MMVHENSFTYSDESSRPEEPECRPAPRGFSRLQLEAALESANAIITALRTENDLLKETIKSLNTQLHRDHVHERMTSQSDDLYCH